MSPRVSPSPTPHAVRAYLPLRPDGRAGVALCLSGGGFRAALFHLGALRRLNELDILSQVTTVTGVSGGSFVAAFLADRLRQWPAGPISDTEWERSIAAPFRVLVSRNLGTVPVLLGWILSWTNAGIALLARRIKDRLTALMLQELPERPRYMFCTTDLVHGGGRVFDRTAEESWPVALAVAVSSCHPAFFPAFHQTRPHPVSLVDGGVADDQGVEPVWKTHEVLLLSDGGDVFQPGWGESVLWSLSRSGTVVWDQLGNIRKRWLMTNFMTGLLTGTYWGIDGSASHYEDVAVSLPGYSVSLARDVIGVIRTAYDAFSDAEIAVLENHGYFLADAATRVHLGHLRCAAPPLKAPHPAWMCERKVRDALKNSANWWPPRW